MNIPLQISTFGLVMFLLLALLLYALTRWLRRLLTYVPMSKARRKRINSIIPVAETIIGLAYILSALPMVINDHPEFAPYVLGSIVIGIAAASWFALRDFINGAFFKSSQAGNVGDLIRIGEQEGRLKSLGYRALTLEAEDGEEIIIPYSRINRRAVVRFSEEENKARHSFLVQREQGLMVAELKLAIRRSVLNCHWSSLVREPDIELLENGQLKVTVFALDATRGPDIESVVRSSMAATHLST